MKLFGRPGEVPRMSVHIWLIALLPSFGHRVPPLAIDHTVCADSLDLIPSQAVARLPVVSRIELGVRIATDAIAALYPPCMDCPMI
jgi:hypothetical protein